MNSKVVIVEGRDPASMVSLGLGKLNVKPVEKIVIKPNLIVNRPPPVTTPVETVKAIAEYLMRYQRVTIAEGSGWCNTTLAYKELGYLDLAEKYGIELVDLNKDSYELRRNAKALALKEFEFPLTLKNSFIISAAVLKVHSITKVSLSLKNMLGATLEEKARIAKKGRFHRKLNESIVDINLYLKPSLAIIDGRQACIDGELGGEAREFNIMIFSTDLVAADAVGAKILGYEPLAIPHLKLAQDVKLGTADLKEIEVVRINAF
ncbi:MAG: DUF362 domain-containing protein [Methanocellales archaeon]